MARRRSKTSATGANMDSLLDALTNVVGILVIVLVAVQLSSQAAARRMEEMIANIDPAEQEEILQRATEAERKLKEIKLAIAEEKEQEEIDPEKLLAVLKEEVTAAEDQANKARLEAEDAEKRVEEKNRGVEESKKQLVKQLVSLEGKEKEFNVAKDALLFEFDNMPTLKAPPPQEVRPPTPKDVPRNPKDGRSILQPRKILVANGKVIPFIDPGKQLETAVKNYVKALLNQNKIEPFENRYITDESQATKVIKEFNDKPLENKFFDLELLKDGKTINVQIIPTEECGEEPEQAVNGIFRDVLRGNQNKWWLQYLVEPDSFETYMAIRKVTDSYGYYAGWSIIEPGSNREQSFSVGYNIGEKPPPRPNRPNPNPGKPRPVKGVLD